MIRKSSADEGSNDTRESENRSKHSEELGAVFQTSYLAEDGDHSDDCEVGESASCTNSIKLGYSQMPAAPTPESARPKMRTLTSLQLPQMAEPTSKTVIAERRTYSAGGRRVS